MSVGGQHRILDHVAHDLAARQRAHIHLLPVRKALARRIFIPLFQRIADAGEVMAELPKAQRDIQHRHTPEHCKRPAQPPQQQPVDGQRDQCRNKHCEAPRHPAVVRFARVEIAAHGQRPRTQPRMDGIAAGQGTCLLDQQSEQDGEETHGGQ